LWPELNGRLFHQLRCKSNGVEIVMKKLALTAMLCVAGEPNERPALAPVTYPANVLALGIGEKDICAGVLALGSSFESATGLGQHREISVIGDCHEYVSIFWLGLGCRERTDQGDAAYPRTGTRKVDEVKDLRQQERSERWVFCR
jgi:hypothetical protein